VMIGARYYRSILPMLKQSNIFDIKTLISNKYCKHGSLYNCVLRDDIYVYLLLHRGIKRTDLTYCGFVHYDTLQSGS
jgi:hypothetical protein